MEPPGHGAWRSHVRLGSIGNSQLKTSMIAGLGGGSVEVQLNLIARALFAGGN